MLMCFCSSFIFLLAIFLDFLAICTAQCSAGVIGCVNCYTWCDSFYVTCSSDYIRNSCKKKCNACSNTAPACLQKNCQQKCTLSSTNTATCSCFSGYVLNANGRTCDDINECTVNPNICVNSPQGNHCVNQNGSYFCTHCNGINDNLWNYYGKSTCCNRNTAGQCGKSSNNGGSRIVGGANSKIAEWPWTAYLTVGDKICGGSLITSSHILTAAHCLIGLTAAGVTVFLGVENAQDGSNIHVQTHRVQQIIRHPNFSNPNNDIAILVLTQPLQHYSDYIQKICLPNGEEPEVGQTCYAAGYGLTISDDDDSEASVLQKVDLPIIDINVCQHSYRNENKRVNPSIHLCAGYVQGGKDTCQGDSGGPLMCQRCANCDWYLAGITSFGKGCGKANFYGVYTRVQAFESWINGTTGLSITSQSCSKTGWSQWSGCSATCGSGTQQRTFGSQTETKGCQLRAQCPVWGSYTWGTCSKSCGGGVRTATRQCINGAVGEIGCIGQTEKKEACSQGNCPSPVPNCVDDASTCLGLKSFCHLSFVQQVCRKTCNKC